MSTWLAALVAIAAVLVTYLLCVRPMRRGPARCVHDPSTAAQLTELRAELRALRQQRARKDDANET